MNRPAVFFDRDNTLIACDGYLGDPDKVVLVEGASDAVARVRELGFAAVVFSNQSGVARGMFPEEAVHAVNHRLDDLLHEENPRATIDRHDFCPYHPTAKVERYRRDSDLRKPKPGMIYQAAGVLGLDLKRSWVVGDAPRDIAAGQTAGLRTVLLKIASLPPSPATNEGAGSAPDFVASSLAEAIDFIARHRDDRVEERSAEPSTTAGQDNGAASEKAGGEQWQPPSATPTADAWTSTAASIAAASSTPAASGTSPGASESSTPSTARAEDPVKLTPRPKSETNAPSAGTTAQAASKPDAAKPKQGGFVVKPNQPPPVGMTWGERMRLAKEGSPISSAAAAAKPVVPKAEVPQPSTDAKPSVESEPPPPEEAAEQPASEAPPEPPAEQQSEPVAEQPAAEPAPSVPAVAEIQQTRRPEESAAGDEADASATQNEDQPAVETPASAEASTPETTAEDAAPVGSEVPRDVGATAEDVPVATAPALEPRRGVRREDLLDHDFDLPAGGTEESAVARRRRDAGTGEPVPTGDLSRVEALLEQVLVELRRREDLAAGDFSASKLVAGITQVLALASLFYAYFNKDTPAFQSTLLVAIALQTLTISLLIMGRQK